MGSVMVMRMQKELMMLAQSPPPGVSAWSVDGNVNELAAVIQGPEDTPYEGGFFKLEINIPDRYPNDPPKVRFVTPVYHPNIDNGGRICLDTLKMPPKGAWTPSLNIPTLLTTLRLLLSTPNPDDPLMPDITEEFIHNHNLFVSNARKWTKKHASTVSEVCEYYNIVRLRDDTDVVLFKGGASALISSNLTNPPSSTSTTTPTRSSSFTSKSSSTPSTSTSSINYTNHKTPTNREDTTSPPNNTNENGESDDGSEGSDSDEEFRLLAKKKLASKIISKPISSNGRGGKDEEDSSSEGESTKPATKSKVTDSDDELFLEEDRNSINTAEVKRGKRDVIILDSDGSSGDEEKTQAKRKQEKQLNANPKRLKS